ncbi:hypothetical protein CR513_17782, partial [Mucuna pruriens]
MLHSLAISMANSTPFPLQTQNFLPHRGLQMELDLAHDQGGLGLKLDEASERIICWYSPWNEREHIIVKCEGYPNVPLLGTQGAINYNLELVVRQVGYPMIRPPPEEVMTPFVLYGPEAHKGIHYRKIRHAWSNTIKREPPGGFDGKILRRDSNAHKYEVQETLEVGKLKATLEQAKVERADLKRELEEAMEEVRREKQLNVEITKKAGVERETRLKVGSCLRAADKEMCARRVERDQVAIEKEQLEKTLLDIQIREEEQREQFRQLQEKMRLLKEELARANLSKECLVDQRRKTILELVKTRTKAEEDEAQL